MVAPYEYLLLDSAGRILEGTGTNFWAVRDGVMYTAGGGGVGGGGGGVVGALIAGVGIPPRAGGGRAAARPAPGSGSS